MWPFSKPKQKPIPLVAQEILNQIPEEFTDDGLTNFPDSLFGFNFKWAGRIHDCGYCTRCHEAGSMDDDYKDYQDALIHSNVSASLPLRWKWVGPVVRVGVWRGGYGPYDSCGQYPDRASDQQLVDGLCRHNIPKPEWMA